MSSTIRRFNASKEILYSGKLKNPIEDIENHAPCAKWGDQLSNKHQVKSHYEPKDARTPIQSGVFIKNSIPVVIAFAVLGLLPVTLKPTLRVAFYPHRSTLLWCLFVFGFLQWSIYVAFSDARTKRHPKEEDGYDFFLLSSMVGLFSLSAIPLFWIELRYGIKKTSMDFCKLEKRVQWLSSKEVTVTSWCLVVSVLEFPVVVYSLRFLDHSMWDLKPISVVAFSYTGFFLFCLPMNIPSWFSSIKVNTVHLAGQFEKELRAGRLTPARVRFHRETWLLLRSVVSRGLLMPYAALTFLQLIMMVNVLYAYNAAVLFCRGSVQSGLCLSYSALTTNGLLFVISHNAQRASDSVVSSYLEVLQDKKYATIYRDSTLHEVELFRQLINKKVTKVSLAGFCDVSRELYCSVTSATFTYVIVLLQMNLQSA